MYLKITLYRNCILNKTYQNVISLGEETYTEEGVSKTSTVLERYLNTLSYPITFQLESVYQEESGVLIFDRELAISGAIRNIYKYNYMKVESYEDETSSTPDILRYCFVEDIKLVNDLVYLSYSEDIWHSYSGDITSIKTSYLSRSRIIDNGNLTFSYYNIPVNYDGNSIMTYQALGNVSASSYYLLAEVEYYELSAKDKVNERESEIVLIGHYSEVREATTPLMTYNDQYTYTFSSISEIEDAIKNMLFSQTDTNMDWWTTDQANLYLCYKIKNFIIIPRLDITVYLTDWFDTVSTTSGVRNYCKRKIWRYTADQSLPRYTWFYYKTASLTHDLSTLSKFQIRNYTLNNNFKRIGIGTLKNIIPVKNLGNNITVKLNLVFSHYSVKVLLEVNNNIYDMTEHFKAITPFDYVDAETIAQQRVARGIENFNNATQIGVGVVQTIADLYSGGIASGVAGDLIGINKTLASHTDDPRLKSRKAMITGTSNQVNEISATIREGATGIGKIAYGITGLIKNNVQVFSNSYSCNVNSEGFINAYFINSVLLEFYTSDTNKNYVKDAINNTGRIVYKYLDDVSDLYLKDPDTVKGWNINYNVLKFENINVHGYFPMNIAYKLENIMEDGFKIWYDYQLGTDNYVV